MARKIAAMQAKSKSNVLAAAATAQAEAAHKVAEAQRELEEQKLEDAARRAEDAEKHRGPSHEGADREMTTGGEPPVHWGWRREVDEE